MARRFSVTNIARRAYARIIFTKWAAYTRPIGTYVATLATRISLAYFATLARPIVAYFAALATRISFAYFAALARHRKTYLAYFRARARPTETAGALWRKTLALPNLHSTCKAIVTRAVSPPLATAFAPIRPVR